MGSQEPTYAAQPLAGRAESGSSRVCLKSTRSAELQGAYSRPGDRPSGSCLPMQESRFVRGFVCGVIGSRRNRSESGAI